MMLACELFIAFDETPAGFAAGMFLAHLASTFFSTNRKNLSWFI